MGQVARVRKNNYVRWAATTIRKLGWLGSTAGTWELTELGREVVAGAENDKLVFPTNIPPLGEGGGGGGSGQTETVKVTDFQGYELPVLRVLSKETGPLKKAIIRERILAALGDQLTAGDTRLMPNGVPVWSYRASWSLSNLKKRGEIENPGPGLWQITQAGRERHSAAGADAPSLSSFQDSSARVQIISTGGHTDKPPPPWPTEAWEQLEGPLGSELLASIAGRLRPDLGATPDDAQIPRNIILYGPPGTGKTFIAKKLAAALTGDDEPGDESRWQLVQFHPSYAYEDFVQGLRPDLKQSPLRARSKTTDHGMSRREAGWCSSTRLEISSCQHPRRPGL